ncbi:MAG: hypothetical protein ACOC56_03095 [Atribacterota bacterium]
MTAEEVIKYEYEILNHVAEKGCPEASIEQELLQNSEELEALKREARSHSGEIPIKHKISFFSVSSGVSPVVIHSQPEDNNRIYTPYGVPYSNIRGGR